MLCTWCGAQTFAAQSRAHTSTLLPPVLPNVLRVFLENGQTKSFRYDKQTTVQVRSTPLLELSPSPPQFHPSLSLTHSHFLLSRSETRTSCHAIRFSPYSIARDRGLLIALPYVLSCRCSSSHSNQISIEILCRCRKSRLLLRLTLLS